VTKPIGAKGRMRSGSIFPGEVLARRAGAPLGLSGVTARASHTSFSALPLPQEDRFKA